MLSSSGASPRDFRYAVKEVRKLGWDYLGRARGTVQYKLWKKKNWSSISGLFKNAPTKAKFIDNFLLSKIAEMRCTAVLVKKRLKRTKKKTPTGRNDISSASRKNADRAREPWLLVSSLEKENYSAHQIANFYERRMQIEENFRDTKSPVYGMGLKKHRSRTTKRIEILLLIGMLAHFISYILGISATAAGLEKQFQANTEKKSRVLSFVFLGRQIYRKPHFKKVWLSLNISEALAQMAQPLELAP